MKKLTNWLLYGFCGDEVVDAFLNDNFDETFLVISKDSLNIYTTQKGYKDVSKLSALVPNTNLYCISKTQEENYEMAEVTKIARFYEYVFDKGIIGLPAARQEDVSDIKIIEKWPLC
jgi:hypothetical protein